MTDEAHTCEMINDIPKWLIEAKEQAQFYLYEDNIPNSLNFHESFCKALPTKEMAECKLDMLKRNVARSIVMLMPKDDDGIALNKSKLENRAIGHLEQMVTQIKPNEAKYLKAQLKDSIKSNAEAIHKHNYRISYLLDADVCDVMCVFAHEWPRYIVGGEGSCLHSQGVGLMLCTILLREMQAICE